MDSGFSKMAPAQDLLSKVASGALKAYLIQDQRRYDQEVMNQRAQHAGNLENQRFGHDQSLEEQRAGNDAKRMSDDDARQSEMKAAEAILAAIRTGTQVTPEVANDYSRLSRLPLESAMNILKATASGVLAGQTREDSETATDQRNELTRIGARGAQERQTKATPSAADKAADPNKEADRARKRSDSIASQVSEWVLELTNDDPTKRKSDVSWIEMNPDGTPPSRRYLEDIASRAYDQGRTPADVQREMLATEDRAFELAGVAGIKEEDIDEPLIQGRVLKEIAKSMGITLEADDGPMTLIDVATTTENAQILRRLMEGYTASMRNQRRP